MKKRFRTSVASTKKITVAFCIFLLAGSFSAQPVSAQPTEYVKKVVLQGFWWDYWNFNFPYGWANYLTELAPRLKSMGIDAVWIPASAKNSSPGSVG